MSASCRDVTFDSKGLACAALYYVADDLRAGERRPAIVMAHGIGATKEMRLPAFVQIFPAAGFCVPLFDYRYVGAGAGEPRQQIFPTLQHEDYRNAITW